MRLNFVRAGTLKVRRTVRVEKGGRRTTWDTKTNAGMRTITLPSSTAGALWNRRRSALSDWVFPDPLKPEEPTNPGSAYSRLKTLLRKAGLPSIPFHSLRHTFATHALSSGVDDKSLSTILGHTSGNTTLNIYAHATETMRKTAAEKIDRGIAKAEPKQEPERTVEQFPAFQPKKGRKRKWGTGSVVQCSANRWRGYFSRVWPDGTTHFKDVYASAEEECETLLREAISEMKKEIAAERERVEHENRTS